MKNSSILRAFVSRNLKEETKIYGNLFAKKEFLQRQQSTQLLFTFNTNVNSYTRDQRLHLQFIVCFSNGIAESNSRFILKIGKWYFENLKVDGSVLLIMVLKVG